jgi:transcriptional regulator with XRE-family HTH domain
MKGPEARGGEEAAPNGSALGRLLKNWRARRGLSQLGLAVAARTTRRHLSFIESGRAMPSRDMVLRLGATLALPLRQQYFAPAIHDNCNARDATGRDARGNSHRVLLSDG